METAGPVLLCGRRGREEPTGHVETTRICLPSPQGPDSLWFPPPVALPKSQGSAYPYPTLPHLTSPHRLSFLCLRSGGRAGMARPPPLMVGKWTERSCTVDLRLKVRCLYQRAAKNLGSERAKRSGERWLDCPREKCVRFGLACDRPDSKSHGKRWSPPLFRACLHAPHG